MVRSNTDFVREQHRIQARLSRPSTKLLEVYWWIHYCFFNENLYLFFFSTNVPCPCCNKSSVCLFVKSLLVDLKIYRYG